RGKRDEIQAAVVEVGLEQAIEREQSGKHGCDPKHARADLRQKSEIGADAQRHQRCDRGKESERQRGAAPGTRGKAQITPQERTDHAAPNVRFSQAIPSGSCVATSATPPAAPCAVISSAAYFF